MGEKTSRNCKSKRKRTWVGHFPAWVLVHQPRQTSQSPPFCDTSIQLSSCTQRTPPRLPTEPAIEDHEKNLDLNETQVCKANILILVLSNRHNRLHNERNSKQRDNKGRMTTTIEDGGPAGERRQRKEGTQPCTEIQWLYRIKIFFESDSWRAKDRDGSWWGDEINNSVPYCVSGHPTSSGRCLSLSQ